MATTYDILPCVSDTYFCVLTITQDGPWPGHKMVIQHFLTLADMAGLIRDIQAIKLNPTETRAFWDALSARKESGDAATGES